MEKQSLPFGGDGSGASSSKRPRFDLHFPPAAEAEPASTSASAPREEEEAIRQRLREENARLIHMYGEEIRRLREAIAEGERRLKEAQLRESIRQQADSIRQQLFYHEYERGSEKNFRTTKSKRRTHINKLNFEL